MRFELIQSSTGIRINILHTDYQKEVNLKVIIENVFLFEEGHFFMPWRQYITASWKIKK